MCALLWINASRTSTEREGERERSLLRLRGREEAGKRDESSSSAESFRNSFKSALRARIEWRSFTHHEFFDDDESILETCHCWERRERHHHHHEEEEQQQQQKSTTTRKNEEKNNNNKTRDEMSNVANGVVLAQGAKISRREGVAEEIITNDDLAKLVETNEVDRANRDWERHVISGDETPTSLAEEASLEALKWPTNPKISI